MSLRWRPTRWLTLGSTVHTPARPAEISRSYTAMCAVVAALLVVVAAAEGPPPTPLLGLHVPVSHRVTLPIHGGSNGSAIGQTRRLQTSSPAALRAALSYPKHSGVSWVWLAIAILVKVKCTLRGLMLRFWAIWGNLGLYE